MTLLLEIFDILLLRHCYKLLVFPPCLWRLRVYYSSQLWQCLLICRTMYF